jgi:hypothetical protein
MPEDSEILCEGWAWDPVLRELRKYRRKKKGWEDEPEAVERLEPAKSVTLHRWSQPPMQSSTGQLMPGSMARVVVSYESGGNLEVNENDRSCAEKLSRAIAESYGLPVIEEGAPGGRRGGNLPERDEMGRLRSVAGKTEVVLDEVAREITVSTSRFPIGKKRRTIQLAELRRLELTYEVRGAIETFTVSGIVTYDEERIPLALYEAYEGWADPQEWRDFTEELGRSLGVETVLPA